MTFLDSMPVEGRHVEWFTPTSVKKDLIEEFGVFDLDPATALSNPMEATRFFTKDDDGLKQDWIGQNIYLNPPYGRIISKFIDKAICEWTLGNCKRIVMLLPSRTDTKWFHKLYEHPDVEIRFFKGRLRFNDANPAPMPSMLAILDNKQLIWENEV